MSVRPVIVDHSGGRVPTSSFVANILRCISRYTPEEHHGWGANVHHHAHNMQPSLNRRQTRSWKEGRRLQPR